MVQGLHAPMSMPYMSTFFFTTFRDKEMAKKNAVLEWYRIRRLNQRNVPCMSDCKSGIQIFEYELFMKFMICNNRCMESKKKKT